MITSTHTYIPGPAGQLELSIQKPANSLPYGIAVIAHPHPVHGGTMRNKVVTTLARLCRDLGLVSYTFNFRGVGQSAGQYDHGKGEQQDLQAVVSFARKEYPSLPLWLGGFSFGANISALAAQTENPACLISICPPIGHKGYQTIAPPLCPWFIVQTDDDELVDANKVKAWVETLHPRPDLISMDHGGHFFHGQLLVLRDKLGDALTHQFPELCHLLPNDTNTP